jgi:hypothetical protein
MSTSPIDAKNKATLSDVRVPLSHANNIKDKYIAAIANDMGKKDWIVYMTSLVCLQD